MDEYIKYQAIKCHLDTIKIRSSLDFIGSSSSPPSLRWILKLRTDNLFSCASKLKNERILVDCNRASAPSLKPERVTRIYRPVHNE